MGWKISTISRISGCTAAPSAYAIVYVVQKPQHHQRITIYATWPAGIFRDPLTVLSLWENIRVIVEIRCRSFFVGVLMPGNILGHIKMHRCNNLGLISCVFWPDATFILVSVCLYRLLNVICWGYVMHMKETKYESMTLRCEFHVPARVDLKEQEANLLESKKR